ncbi:unnamed protein product, partial [Polarella glacialis]
MALASMLVKGLQPALQAARRRLPPPSTLRQSRSFSAAAEQKTRKVAVYPGDGIGVEVTALTFELLDELQRRCQGGPRSFKLQNTWYDWGCDYLDRNGTCAPPDMLSILRP